MAMTLPSVDDRRQYGRRWTRGLLLLALLASLGWTALTSYHFRGDLSTYVRLLWTYRNQVAAEYAPGLAGLVPPLPNAVPVEDVLRARVPRPVAGQVWVADVLVGSAVYKLKQIGPLIVGPALALLAAGFLVALLVGRLMQRLEPREFGRIWPVIVVPTLLAFGAGTVFGLAAFYFRVPIRALFGM